MLYDSALLNLEKSLKDNGSFKTAVFTVENAYFKGNLSDEKFYEPIDILKSFCKEWAKNNKSISYKYSDSNNLMSNYSIFKVLKDTIKIIDSSHITYLNLPFTYEFHDFNGKESWTDMFVSKLLITKRGNCHSLPYLYKILADELGAICWLSLAPNHMYVKNRSLKDGWYNTELTSGEFPIDAWIATSGYVSMDAIRNGIYMDTLSNQQAIALCVLDLAKGYEFQTKNYYDGFIVKCCDLTLQYHPVNVQALLLKAETLKKVYERQKAEKDKQAMETYGQMEKQYTKLVELGYREMPEKMYLQWLRSVTEQKSKYGNVQISKNLKRN